jgi:hypothetical protein
MSQASPRRAVADDPQVRERPRSCSTGTAGHVSQDVP